MSASLGLPSKDMGIILVKLAIIKAQQRHQGQLLQQILSTLKKESDDPCELPDCVSLPVENIADLTELKKN